jgi:hypothetical protein
VHQAKLDASYSILTPGLAGGITMMIANSLWVQYALP